MSTRNRKLSVIRRPNNRKRTRGRKVQTVVKDGIPIRQIYHKF